MEFNLRNATFSRGLLVALAVLVLCASANARYLPTRSDNSRPERIKEALRLNCCKQGQSLPSSSHQRFGNATMRVACRRCQIPSSEVKKSSMAIRRRARSASGSRKCSDSSPDVLKCMRKFSRSKKLDESSPTHNAHCCDMSEKFECRQACRRVLRSEIRSEEERMDAIISSGCGQPMLDDKLWQCFLRSAAKTTSSSKVAPSKTPRPRFDSTGGGSLAKKSKKKKTEDDDGDGDAIAWSLLGYDAAKLGCCRRASSNSCRQLCVKTFSDDWNENWPHFDRQCLQPSGEQKELLRCFSDAEEPCRLGCSGLSFCGSLFNEKPLDLFRSCNKRADVAAERDFQNWMSRASIPFSFMEIPLLNGTHCDRSLLKAVSCTLQVRPCHPKSHQIAICKSDCVNILSKCLDKSRLHESTGKTTSVESICDLIASSDADAACVSISNFLDEAGVTSLQFPSRAVISSPSSAASPSPKQLFAASVPLGMVIAATNPCLSSPCPADEMCLINEDCRLGQTCDAFKCQPACRLGEMSSVLIARGALAHVAKPREGDGCHMACTCETNGAFERCTDLPCVRNISCVLDTKEIAHQSRLTLECRECMCFSGEITCSLHKSADCKGNDDSAEGLWRADGKLESNTDYDALINAECDCKFTRHYRPVCGFNGKTYPSPCIAQCDGLEESQFKEGDCMQFDPCVDDADGQPRCHLESQRCVARRTVCLSASRANECKQHVCLNITEASDCSSSALRDLDTSPVCDTLGLEHSNACWLIKKRRTLAYWGKCKGPCSQSTQGVCGHDGQTYNTECEALANNVPVDYFARCDGRGLSSSGCRGSPADMKDCARRLESCPSSQRIHLPGSCCPVCASALRLSYSRQLASSYLQRLGSPERVMSVRSLADQLQLLIGSSDCRVFCFPNLEGDLILLLQARSGRPGPQQSVCRAEAARIRSLVDYASPLITSQLPLALLLQAELFEPVIRDSQQCYSSSNSLAANSFAVPLSLLLLLVLCFKSQLVFSSS